MPITNFLQQARTCVEAALNADSIAQGEASARIGQLCIAIHNAEQNERRDALARDTLTKAFLFLDPSLERPPHPAVTVCDNPECGIELAHTGTDREGDPLGAGQYAGTCPVCKSSMRIKDSESEA